jgi:mannose-6-phosphate isomerase-like protein (cupin superfamily)
VEQVFLQIGEGERIAGDDELGVTLLADIEQLGAVEVRSAPGGVAPPLHVHAQHAEAFFVFESELTFRLEDGERRAERETWVFIPPEVVHTFAVTGDEPARFLDLHVPSFGFGDFVRGLHAAGNEGELRAVRAAFDQRSAPEYAAGDPGLAVLRRTGGAEGETITDRPGRRLTLLIEADELTVTEFVHGPGERGAEPHIHRHHADGFLIVEGELTFIYRDGPLVIPAGTFLLIPPGVVHGFDNEGTTNVRCFNFHAPSAGFGDHLRGRNPDFDQHDPPDDGGVDPAAIVAVRLSQ